jgi:hypothetical protein
MLTTRRLSWSLGLALAACGVWPLAAQAPKHFALESTAGLRLQNVNAVAETFQGKASLKVTEGNPEGEELVVVEGVEFGNGTIRAEMAGAPAPGAQEGARGFVGIAFRVQPDLKTYDAFYLRPTNGRAEDQERRNHATQYISHPDWPWFRLRKETPSKYESYADILPDAWTKVRIEVRGDHARMFVNDAAQPTLLVNDVKSGATAKGGVALWIGSGTIAHFRDLTVTP